ncbi:MAG TPA: arsenical pump-driving ATPase [Planctomycetota bacterium]|nr:arsenical pump-driving ATPase [Planctomycetota bacterium]
MNPDDSVLIKNPTRHLFFTGKGGVGKTSVACATAVQLADMGRRVLLVSTDPASNLDEVLDTPLTAIPKPVALVPNLMASNLDPVAEAAAYRERVVGPYCGMLPDAAVRSMEEQLSGACTVEIAAFDAFAKLLGDPAATSQYDHVIFDTAPTGHTLRLLQLPAAWSSFMDNNVGGNSCLGPLDGLQAQRHLYAATVAALRDPESTTVVLVSRPDRLALQEADRTRHELSELGVSRMTLVINGIFESQTAGDPIAVAMQQRQADALAGMPDRLKRLSSERVPLVSKILLGAEALRTVFPFSGQRREAPSSLDSVTCDSVPNLPGSLAALVTDLSTLGHGVIFTMGKGGVGKTTIAAAIAVALARHGHKVLLTTTDPAAHVSTVVGEGVPGLRVSRIDPVEETRAYMEEVMSNAGASLDAKGRALLEEDLRSPCTEEIAVFRGFAREVEAGKDGFVILDTAPTGHTLLLLDSTEAYHREVLRAVPDKTIPDSVRNLLPRLRDTSYTHMLIVTLPEATPVHEAAQLQRDLNRAGIHPFAWIINQSLSPLKISDPVLQVRRANERKYIGEVQHEHAKRVAIVPWLIDPPVGADALCKVGCAEK